MEEEKQHSCRNDERTISDIEKYGLSVILIEATDYLPSFAYSIGLWEKYEKRVIPENAKVPLLPEPALPGRSLQ